MSEHAIMEYLKTLGDLGSITDLFRPVGSYFKTDDATFDPNDVWGGEWELLGEGVVLISGSEDGTYQVGNQYGANAKQIQDSNIAHGHGFTQPTVDQGGGTNNITGGSHHHATYRKKNAGSGSAVYVPDGGSTTNGISTTDTTHTHSLPDHTHRVTGGAVSDLGTPSSRADFDVMQLSKAVYIWHRIA